MTFEMLWIQWEHVIIASIQEGMPMVNNILTILAFVGFVFEKLINSHIPSRLLGVNIVIVK